MPTVFVRKSRRGDWDKVTDQTAVDLSFPANVLSDILDDENEISVWEVSEDLDAEELDLIVAALHGRNTGSLSEVTLRVISGWKVKTDLKLTMKKTKGGSLDEKLNSAGKHEVIQISTVGEAIALAKAFKAKPPIFYSQEKVMRAMASSIASGRIKTENISSSLMKKLFEGGHLQLRVLPDEPSEAQQANSDNVAAEPAKT
ncbi:hypothetical protein ABH973_006743 [Bradyrhizobium ottawaense]|uniref:hypothetical protein n=1 Tax=Bradyrhizobium ottawaense TaxID=931866 RepID=UPI003511D300